jgi:peptide/nickel transport system substrate-binding protein
MKRNKWLSILIISIMLLSALAACGPKATPKAPAATKAAATKAPAAKKPKTIIFGLYQEPDVLNPFIATQYAADEVSRMVVEGLVEVDPNGEYFPVLAKEVPSPKNGLVSKDGLEVTYHLKEGVVWSDGVPFTCKDVVFTWKALTTPGNGAVNTSGYDKISSVTCDGDYTVHVKFSKFYAPYLTLFDNVLPEHAAGDIKDMTKWEYNTKKLLGTGPFVLKEWVSGDHITLVKNPKYRDYPAKPKVDQIIVRIIPSREVGKALITSGEIDILWDLTEADVPEFKNNPDVVVHKKKGPGTERLLLNLADPTLDATDDPLHHPHPILGDLRVRQAIQYGIDKQLIVNKLLYGATTVGTSELSIGWAKCNIPPSKYDPEKAKKLLDEAGFVDKDGDGIRECHGCKYAKEGTPLKLKIQTTSGNQLREDCEQLLVEMMKKIGVQFYIENVPSSELFGSWSSGAFRKHGHFDILMYTTSEKIDPQAHMYGYFHKNSIPTKANNGKGFNYVRWINDRASEALDKAGSSPDLEVRKAAYQVACEEIAKDIPHLYLYDRSEIHLTRSNIKGFEVNPWRPQTWNVAEWDKQ